MFFFLKSLSVVISIFSSFFTISFTKCSPLFIHSHNKCFFLSLWNMAKPYVYLIRVFVWCRMAAERDLEKSECVQLANVLFDSSGHFVVYATMLGVKVVNLVTNRCVAMLGKPENLRPLHLALFQVNTSCILFYYYLCYVNVIQQLLCSRWSCVQENRYKLRNTQLHIYE